MMKSATICKCLFLFTGFLWSGCQAEKSIRFTNQEISFLSIQNESKKVIGDPFYFKHAEIVPLESTLACIMGGVVQIEVADSLLFIKDTFDKLYLFKRNGKFITQIGNKGEGPGEYLLLSSFFIDKEKHLVNILDDYKGNILRYDYKGNFVDNINISIENIRRCRQAVLTSNSKILINNYFNFEENMGYTFLDISKDSISSEKIFPYSPIFIKDHTYAFSKHAMEKVGKEIHFIMPLCDTIYAYSDRAFYPKYVIETPQKMVDKREFSDISVSNPYFMIMLQTGQKGYFTGFTELFETDDMLLLNYRDNGAILGFYIGNKKTKEGNYYLYTASFDKQMPVIPIVGSYGNQFIGTYECDNILDFKDRIDIRRPEYEKLKTIMEGNHADFNPILVFYSN